MKKILSLLLGVLVVGAIVAIFPYKGNVNALEDAIPPEPPSNIKILDHKGKNLGCGGNTNNRTITVDWDPSTSADVAYYRYDIIDEDDRAHFTDTEYTGAIRDLDGYYQYRVWAVDDVGNISEESTGWCGVTLDRVTPEISWENPVHGNSYEGYIELKAICNEECDYINFWWWREDQTIQDAIDNKQYHYVHTNGTEFSWGMDTRNPLHWDGTIGSPLNGTYTFRAAGKDLALNRTVTDITVVIDNVPPTAEYTYFRNGEEIFSSPAYIKDIDELAFTANYEDADPSSGLNRDVFVIFRNYDLKAYCSWNQFLYGGGLHLSGTSYSLTVPQSLTICESTLEEGNYHLRHRVYDNAIRSDAPTYNQHRQYKTLDFVVDKTSPGVTLTSPNTDTVTGEVKVHGTAFDLHLNYFRVIIHNDVPERVADTGKTYTAESSINKDMLSWDTSSVPEGNYKIYLIVEDKAGNRTTLTKEIAVDSDDDGLVGEADLCPDTLIPDFPKEVLGVNRHVWYGEDSFVTRKPPKKEPFLPELSSFSLTDTHGCSCEQILEKLESATGDEFEGHYKFGCSKSILEDWIDGYYYLETLSVPAYSPELTLSSHILFPMYDYKIKAYGTAEAGDSIIFDPQYSITGRIAGDSWTDSVSGYETYGPGLLELFVNGSDIDWGGYNEDHTYYYELAGTGNPLSLYINDIYYPNNKEYLSADLIIKLY